jgi:hypothetical protein
MAGDDAATEPRFHHICEVCGRDEILTPEQAYKAGWDYPPKMGKFGIVSPRLCPKCLMVKSVWWAVAMDGYTADMLTDHQRAAIARMLAEPESLAVVEES